MVVVTVAAAPVVVREAERVGVTAVATAAEAMVMAVVETVTAVAEMVVVAAVAETVVGAVEMDAPHKPGRRSRCMGIPGSRSPPSRPGCTPCTGG